MITELPVSSPSASIMSDNEGGNESQFRKNMILKRNIENAQSTNVNNDSSASLSGRRKRKQIINQLLQQVTKGTITKKELFEQLASIQKEEEDEKKNMLQQKSSMSTTKEEQQSEDVEGNQQRFDVTASGQLDQLEDSVNVNILNVDNNEKFSMIPKKVDSRLLHSYPVNKITDRQSNDQKRPIGISSPVPTTVNRIHDNSKQVQTVEQFQSTENTETDIDNIEENIYDIEKENNQPSPLEEEYTFKPYVRDLPPMYGSLKDRDKPFHERINKWVEERNFNAQKRKEDQALNELQGCTFQPRINQNSRKAAEASRMADAIASQMKLHIQEQLQMHQQQQNADGTSVSEFTTSEITDNFTNLDNNSMTKKDEIGIWETDISLQPDVSERLYSYAKKNQISKSEKAKKAKALEDEEFRRTCTFKPTLKTNKKMAVKYDNYMDESFNESSHLNIGIEHIDKKKTHHGSQTPNAKRKLKIHQESMQNKSYEHDIKTQQKSFSRPQTPTRRINRTTFSTPRSYNGTPQRSKPVLSERSKTKEDSEYTFKPKVNKVTDDMIHAKTYLDTPVVDRLTNTFVLDTTHRSQSLSKPNSPIRPSSAPTRPRPGQQNGDDNSINPCASIDMDGSFFSAGMFSFSSDFQRSKRTSITMKEFNQFLQSQEQRELLRKKRIEDIASKVHHNDFKPKICPTSEKMTKKKGTVSFLERMERDTIRKDQKMEKILMQQHNIPKECTFTPHLISKSYHNRYPNTLKSSNNSSSNIPTDKSNNPSNRSSFSSTISRQAPKTPAELSKADLLKRETNRRILKMKIDKERYAECTFKPSLNPVSKTLNKKITSKLQLSEDPDNYVIRCQLNEAKKMEHTRKAQQEKMIREMDGCTFRPQISECPSFVKRIAKSMALTKMQKNNEAENTTNKHIKPEWR